MIQTAIGARPHLITLENPGGEVPDGSGGFTEGWAALVPPTAYARIEPAALRDLERVVANTVESSATHIITLPYHPGVTMKTRIRFGTRIFAVAGMQNLEERNIELRLACEEITS